MLTNLQIHDITTNNLSDPYPAFTLFNNGISILISDVQLFYDTDDQELQQIDNPIENELPIHHRHHINITIHDTHCTLNQSMVDTVIRSVNDIRYKIIIVIIIQELYNTRNGSYSMFKFVV